MKNLEPTGGLGRQHVQYDDSRQRLYVSTRWGILCLHASPFEASGIDLRAMQGHNWSELHKVHLDLRQPLRLIQRVHPGRHLFPVSCNVWRPTREQAYAPIIVDRSNAWLQFFKDVGGYDLCRSIARYHPTIQYHALWFASRCARLASLAESNPGLFVGVILLAQTEPSDPHTQLTVAQQLAQGREREICERLGYETHAWRSLARLLPRGLTDARWRAFRSAWWRSRRVRTFARHLPQLDALAIDLLSTASCADVLDYRALLDLVQNRFYAHSPRLGQLVRWVVQVVALHACRSGAATKIRSAGQLEQAVRFLDNVLDFTSIPDVSSLGFPRPPFPGEAGYIEPIETVHDLCFESLQMRNCAIAYADQIAAGERYFYRAHARWGMPRCTIALRRSDEKESATWQVGQARRKHNEPCGQQTREVLECFFEQQRQLVGRWGVGAARGRLAVGFPVEVASEG